MILGEERSEEELIVDCLRNSHFVFGKSPFGYFTEDNVDGFLQTEAFQLVEQNVDYEVWQRFGIKIYLVDCHNEFSYVSRILEEKGIPLTPEHYATHAVDYWPQS